MKKLLNRMSIQSKLMAIFGVIVVAGAAAVSIGLLNVLLFDEGVAELVQRFERLDKPFAVQESLQGLEAAENGFLLTRDPVYLQQRERHTEELDLLLREALLEAEEAAERDALYGLVRMQEEHDEAFQQLAGAIQEPRSEAEIARLGEAVTQGRAEMQERVQEILDTHKERMAETDEQASLYGRISFILTVVDLVNMSLLSIAAMAVLFFQLGRPIARLTQAAEAVEAGTFEPDLLQKYTERQDEIGRLAQTFIQMADGIAAREAELEREVEELA
jgi:nitrogen fixation/metabolism regulation signal transduction histidine kinase